MNKRCRIMLCIILIAILSSSANLSGQGFFIPREEFSIDKGSLILKELNIDVEINNQNADVQLDQKFINESRYSFEGTYIFPAPRDAAVRKFSIFYKGKEIKGEILEKNKARGIYEKYVRRFRDPGLLEFMDQGMLRASVFPIYSGEKTNIFVEYDQELKTIGDLVKLSISLVNLKRSRCQDFIITAHIRDNNPINNIYSPSHNIDIERISNREVKISFEGTGEVKDGDFILYYGISRDETGMNLATFKKSDEDGYFMLLVSPLEYTSRPPKIGQDIVFVLDKSGSMSGKKIQQAKDALTYCLNQLNDEDRFNILFFSTNVESFNKTLVNPSEHRREAINFTRNIEASGGTNINDALLDALKLKEDTQRPFVVIFLTDGLPTVGEMDIGKIVKTVTEKAPNNVRFFNFGVGYDVNTHLLDLIALKNRGTSDYIEPGENIEQIVSSFFDKISKPSMTDISIDFGDMIVKEIYPVKMPDLFYGSQIAVFGRYDGWGSETIILKGKVNDIKKELRYETYFPNENDENDFLSVLWARRKVGYLMDEIRLNGENKELVVEIVNLAKKYGIVTPYTSFLALEDEPFASTPYPPGRRQRPFIIPQYQLDKLNAVESEDFTAPLISVESGKTAVKVSKLAKSLKENFSLSDVIQSSLIKRIENQTFYLKNNFWVSSDYKEGDKTVNIKYMSDAYFEILNRFEDIKQFLSIGDKVVFKYKNIFIKISESGKDKLDEDFFEPE